MTRIKLLVSAIAFTLVGFGGCYVSVPKPVLVTVTEAPPAPIVEVRTSTPAANYIWIEGYWSWSAGSSTWLWISGDWQPTRANYVWVVPHYELKDGQHYYAQGGWVKNSGSKRGYKTDGDFVEEEQRYETDADREKRKNDNAAKQEKRNDDNEAKLDAQQDASDAAREKQKNETDAKEEKQKNADNAYDERQKNENEAYDEKQKNNNEAKREKQKNENNIKKGPNLSQKCPKNYTWSNGACYYK